MKYTLKYEPYERDNDDVENTITFDAKDDVDAKLKMCSLFYGYDTIRQMADEQGFDPNTESKEKFLGSVIRYVDYLNGDSELDYFISLTNDRGEQVWGAKNEKIQEEFE